MHQITQLLFADLFNKGGLGRGEVMEALEDVGLSLESVGRLITFKYEDGASLHVQLCFYPDDRLHHVSLSIGIEGDVKGWAGWSKDREMQRLAKQEGWMYERGIEESSSGRLRISNTFSPQDGSSSITIKTAEQGVAPQSATLHESSNYNPQPRSKPRSEAGVRGFDVLPALERNPPA